MGEIPSRLGLWRDSVWEPLLIAACCHDIVSDGFAGPLAQINSATKPPKLCVYMHRHIGRKGIEYILQAGKLECSVDIRATSSLSA